MNQIFNSVPQANRPGLAVRFGGLTAMAFSVILTWTGVASAAPQPTPVFVKPTQLPVAVDESISFRKTKIQTYDSVRMEAKRERNIDPMLGFERSRILHGAVTPGEIREREGNYFSFFWRAKRTANLTVRFEFRQANLGAHVQAMEVSYPAVKGSKKTEFQVTGDACLTDGRVISWRALLIENGKIVASTESFLWR